MAVYRVIYLEQVGWSTEEEKPEYQRKECDFEAVDDISAELHIAHVFGQILGRPLELLRSVRKYREDELVTMSWHG